MIIRSGRGQAGCDGHTGARRARPGPLLMVFVPRSHGGGKTLTEKTTAAAAAADAGVVFYNYGGHRINQ